MNDLVSRAGSFAPTSVAWATGRNAAWSRPERHHGRVLAEDTSETAKLGLPKGLDGRAAFALAFDQPETVVLVRRSLTVEEGDWRFVCAISTIPERGARLSSDRAAAVGSLIEELLSADAVRLAGRRDDLGLFAATIGIFADLEASGGGDLRDCVLAAARSVIEGEDRALPVRCSYGLSFENGEEGFGLFSPGEFSDEDWDEIGNGLPFDREAFDRQFGVSVGP